MVPEMCLLDQSLPVSLAGTTVEEGLLVGWGETRRPINREEKVWQCDFDDDAAYDNTFLRKADWQKPAWVDKAKDDLKAIASLGENWDSYGSPPIREELCRNAEEFLNCLEAEVISPPFVVPISGGGVQFEWGVNNHELEVEFLESNVLGYLKIVEGEPIDEGELALNDYASARRLIEWLTETKS